LAAAFPNSFVSQARGESCARAAALHNLATLCNTMNVAYNATRNFFCPLSFFTMDIERTLAVINQMLADGVIENYALGGAVAAIFYTEPIDTQDVDIFVQVKSTGSDFTILLPIYDYLLKLGFQAKAEHIYIEGFPVQFLPTFNALTEEAVNEAQEFRYYL
jgi:hypothetical protein